MARSFNVIAVDVGTASVRLAIVKFQSERLHKATVLAKSTRSISHTQDGLKFEQDSREIWQAICDCSRECLRSSYPRVDPSSIKAIAFSATCSLVIQDDDSSIRSNINNKNNIIMWMDHRAIGQAQRITDSRCDTLMQFGGVCSPEFSLAKLVWLKENEPNRFQQATGFFELPDWLVHKCISYDCGKASKSPRSLCCVTCKMGFNAETNEHCDIINKLFKNSAGLKKVGQSILKPGSVAGELCFQAAIDLGLVTAQDQENKKVPKIVVGSSLIDAHSGMLAMLSVPFKKFGIDLDVGSTICSLAGTSSCHMLLSRDLLYRPGIWGPYKDVIIEGFNLLEAGQSLTGKMIEICIQTNEEGKRRLQNGERVYDIIVDLNKQAHNISSKETLSSIKNLHVLPTYHGNRSPLANPRLKGGIYGLSAEREKSLLEYYVATVESLAYELKFIVTSMGIKLSNFIVSGGLATNSFYMQTLADVLECNVIKAGLEQIDFMVMGSALLARHATLNSISNFAHSLTSNSQNVHDNHIKCISSKPLTKESIEDMEYSQLEMEAYRPNPGKFHYHDRKYRCYGEFVDFSLKIDDVMSQSG